MVISGKNITLRLNPGLCRSELRKMERGVCPFKIATLFITLILK